MTNRSPRAALSPIELNALRRIASGGEAVLQPDHLNLLLAMGLAGLGVDGRASLMEDGQQRRRAADGECA